jgi:hypothetical protein
VQTPVQENVLNEEQGSVKEEILVQLKFQISESLREVSSHPLCNIIENLREGVSIRSGLNQMIIHCAFIS